MQTTVQLRYGQMIRTFKLPAAAKVLKVREPAGTVSKELFLKRAKFLPAGLPEQSSIAVVVADKTRLCGYNTYLPWLLDALRDRGASADQVTFFIAYGTHPPQSEQESRAAYGAVYEQYQNRFVHHRCDDPSLFRQLGTTARGTQVRVRRELLEADLIITFGAISHHYFAGFGGGRKLLFPGLGEQGAIYANHRLFLDQHHQSLASGCRPGNLDSNPLAEDLAEIEAMLPPYYSVHGILNSHGTVTDLLFGKNYGDFLAACRIHDAHYKVSGHSQYSLVLASAGGYPKDINFIQAHKAIHNAAAFVRDGGTLLMLAECSDGIGSSTFLPYFNMGGWEATFTHLADDYRGNGGTALAMMAKTRRITIRLVTALSRELCRQIGVRSTGEEEAAHLVRAANEDIAVIDNASMLIR